MMRVPGLLVLVLVACCGTAAAAPAFHLDLSPVQFTRAPGQVQPVTGTIRNDGPDSLFIQGILTDVPESMGGDSASAGFLDTAPAALGPGEAWTGEILTLHLAPNVALGSYVFSVDVLGADGEYDAPTAAGTYFQVDVDTVTVVGVAPGPILVERLMTSPNPFRSSTGVRLDLTTPRTIEVCVYDVTGRLVRRLFRGPAEAGRHLYKWDGTDAGGRRMGSGVYLVQVQSGTKRFLNRTVLLR